MLRKQKLPFFNFTYGGLTGNDCEAREAVEHLREWSLDTVSHRFHNSHRSDLHVEPGYTPYLRVARAISPRNQDSSWGSRSALHYDGGSGGRSVIPPVGWLEDYWMGRYFGMIEAPTTNEPELISISADKTLPPLAAPYDGPQRPGT